MPWLYLHPTITIYFFDDYALGYVYSTLFYIYDYVVAHYWNYSPEGIAKG